MSKKYSVKNTGCASSIWKNFSDYEKNLWNMFYVAFKMPHLYPQEWGENGKSCKDKQGAVAHNCAIEAVHVMRHRNYTLNKKNPYEMLMTLHASMEHHYTVEQRRLFDKLAKMLWDEYCVCGELAVRGENAKIRLYDWKD